MPYALPHFNPEQVNEAGSELLRWAANAGPREPGDSRRLTTALDVLDSWRAAHGHPLNVFQTTLRSKADDVEKRALVVQRLKRFPAIYNKLRKYKDKFTLSEMQDIAGCRAVLSSVEKVDELVVAYQEYTRRHDLLYTNDYIRGPNLLGIGASISFLVTEVSGDQSMTAIELKCSSAHNYSILGQQPWRPSIYSHDKLSKLVEGQGIGSASLPS